MPRPKKTLSFNLLVLIMSVVVGCLGFNEKANAKYCDATNLTNSYKDIYCGMRVDKNEQADKKVLDILSTQFEMDTTVIEGILADTICEDVSQMTDEQKEKLPKRVVDTCSPKSISQTQQVLASNLFADVRNRYEKEKALLLNSMILKAKFKASEDYWDGKVGGSLDAPFDLVSDLNLMEIVLFGSKAQWMSDVFSFPEKNEGFDEDEVPLDGLAEDEAQAQEQGNGFVQTEDPGVSLVEGEGELPPGCIPDENPGNLSCGDGKMDVLLGEQCDDGNKVSGDGCNQFCQSELGGQNTMCSDPEAITFKKPGQGAGNGESQNEEESSCPPGSIPGIPEIVGEETTKQEVEQNLNYPGPLIGGTLKQFPESSRPECGIGESPVEITVAGKKYIVRDDEGKARCLPTQFCGDFDAARDFLFGNDWEDDDVLANIAPAIEAMFCVDVVKANRPLTAYPVIEGCIDCHISAMVDTLEKALSTNVSPLENTMGTFGISNRFGPNFSFNLRTATKKQLTFKTTGPSPNIPQEINEELEKMEQESVKPVPTIKSTDNSLQSLERREAAEIEQREKYKADVSQYRFSSGAISDIELSQRVKPLLIQMNQSFSNIQSMYQGLVDSTALDEKQACEI